MAGHRLPRDGRRPGPDGGGPAPPQGLPRQRRGTTPQMRGRYPDYDVLAERGHWDAVTEAAIRRRVEEVPPIRFFTEREAATLRAFCDTVTGQDAEPRIPVLEMVDARLFAGRLDGFRYAELPADPETWRRAARNLDRSAAARRRRCRFADLAEPERRELVAAFAAGTLDWDDLPAARAFSVMMRAVVTAFYSHPWAWNEIGFGGPAYPRGYARLGAGQREPWERRPVFETDPVADLRRRSDPR